MGLVLNIRIPAFFAALLVLGGAGYLGYSALLERLDPDIALERFDQAFDRGDFRRAAELGMNLSAEGDADTSQPITHAFTARLSHALIESGRSHEAVTLLEDRLAVGAKSGLPPRERLDLDGLLARAYLAANDWPRAIASLDAFLRLAGDAALPHKRAAQTSRDQPKSIEALYADAVLNAAPLIAKRFAPVPDGTKIAGDVNAQLATARQMTTLGGHLSLYDEHLPAAAGLLATSYAIRKRHLADSDNDLAHHALLLGPVYLTMQRYEAAEAVLEDSLRATEARLASAEGVERDHLNRRLPLMIKRLAFAVGQQGRQTEAAALRLALKNLVERERARNATVSPVRIANIFRSDVLARPVSRNARIPVNYQPNDLVLAEAYALPVSRSGGRAGEDAITVSLAPENIPDDRDATMPILLGRLINSCSADANGDRANALETITIARGFEPASPSTNESKALSEHQLGLAVDINVNGRLMRPSDRSWMCFEENAYRFGFIASLPMGNTYLVDKNGFEPWHWRFIGRSAATLYREAGPVLRPQEFLSAIDCFQRLRAESPNRLDSSARCLASPEDWSARTSDPEKPASLLSEFSEPEPAEGYLRAGSPGDEQDVNAAAARALQFGPAFVRRGRLEDADVLYQAGLRAMETAMGADDPVMGLMVGLLADSYDRQGAHLQAEALRQHMATIYRNAQDTGQSRATENGKARLPAAAISRPVTRTMPLPPTYYPGDLDAAANHGVPTSKDPGLDEMKLRLASDTPAALPRNRDGADRAGASLSATLHDRLAALIDQCSQETPDERLSLRSGFRAYETQADLFRRLRHRGTVTPPGMSEHQTGLAADIDVNGRFMAETDAAYACFSRLAPSYGFILSYPKGNAYLPGADTFEPWHWRYVGIETAELYRDQGPAEKPQEFLAALTCYEQQAEARLIYDDFPAGDLCYFPDPDLEVSDAERDAVAALAAEYRERERQRALAEAAAEAEEAARVEALNAGSKIIIGTPDAPDHRGTTPQDSTVDIEAAEDPARILNSPVRRGKTR